MELTMSSWSEIENTPSAGTHEVVPAGSHAAVCVGLVNLGNQDTEYQGVKSVKRQIILGWELCSEIISGTTNRHIITEMYTLSLDEKAKLAIMLKSWRGKPVLAGEKFDVRKLLGVPCLLSVTHSEGGYAKLAGVSQLPKGMRADKPKRELVVCGIDEESEIPEWLPWSYGKSVGTIVSLAHEMRPAGTTVGPKPSANGTHADGPDNSDESPF